MGDHTAIHRTDDARAGLRPGVADPDTPRLVEPHFTWFARRTLRYSTLIGEISPTAQRGAMLGITNSIHTLAGLCAPLAMGLLVDVNSDPAAGFRAGFVYAGILVALLGTAAAVLIDPEADRRDLQSNRHF
jgi:tetrahydromethanopterin S-methyltransferase subunit F